ncbi:hypothetical protein [Actinocorallia libanotica]|uniref:Uncharacterized protein n=2 Tax=Actinocorallia TaxID=58108 RepID=A0ABP6GWZ6_9ACTN
MTDDLHLQAAYIRAVRSALADLNITTTSITYGRYSARLQLSAACLDAPEPPFLHWSGTSGWTLTRTEHAHHEPLHAGLIPHHAVVAHAVATLFKVRLTPHMLQALAAYIAPSDDLRSIHVELTPDAEYRRLVLERGGVDPATLTVTTQTLADLIEELGAAYYDWTGRTP